MKATPTDDLLTRAYERRFRLIRANRAGRDASEYARRAALKTTASAAGVSLERVKLAVRVGRLR